MMKMRAAYCQVSFQGVGVVIEGNVINGDEAVVIELEIWMALKKSLSHNCFCTSYT